MLGKGIYLGFRVIDYPERTNNAGVKLPALKGKSYTFFQNRWKKGALTEKGMFANMLVKDDEEQPKLERGEVYDIDIYDMEQRACKLVTDDGEEYDD